MSDDLREGISEEVTSAVKKCYNRNHDNYNLIYPFTTENIAGYIDFFDLKVKYFTMKQGINLRKQKRNL